MNSSAQNEREATEQEQSGAAAEEGSEHFGDVARGEEGESAAAAAAADPGGEHL